MCSEPALERSEGVTRGDGSTCKDASSPVNLALAWHQHHTKAVPPISKNITGHHRAVCRCRINKIHVIAIPALYHQDMTRYSHNHREALVGHLNQISHLTRRIGQSLKPKITCCLCYALFAARQAVIYVPHPQICLYLQDIGSDQVTTPGIHHLLHGNARTR